METIENINSVKNLSLRGLTLFLSSFLPLFLSFSLPLCLFADSWDPVDDTAVNGTTIIPTSVTQSHGVHDLSATDTTDWFKINMIAGYLYHFDTICGLGDNYGQLYSDSDGTNLVASDDDSGGNGQFSINYTATNNQTYYLKIRAYSSGGSWSGSLNYFYRISNSAPTLSWTGETNYVSDGLNPETGSPSTTLTYRVKYTDADNDAPIYGCTILSVYKDGNYYASYNMLPVDANDTNYADGKLYMYSLQLSSGTGWTYQFYAWDICNAYATGAPTTEINAPDICAPQLFTISGYIKDSAERAVNDVLVNLNTSNWPYTLIQSATTTVTGYYEFTDVAEGGNYTATPSKVGYNFSPGNKSYSNLLTNQTDQNFTENHAPTLSWTGETNYVSDGLNPETGSPSTTLTYRVKYTDADNDAPSFVCVVVSTAPGAGWQGQTQYSMNPVDANDTNYADGKLYMYSLQLSSGTGWTYQFYAWDICNAYATGAPTTEINAPDICAPQLFTISGYIKDSAERAASDVLVNLNTSNWPYTLIQSATTTVTGYYEFTDVAEGGNYTATPAKTNYTFSPGSKSYSILMANQADQNFIGMSLESTAKGIAGWTTRLTGHRAKYTGYDWSSLGIVYLLTYDRLLCIIVIYETKTACKCENDVSG